MAGLREQFAAALRAAREAGEMSQSELAERAGISAEAYGRLERGRVLPRAETLVRLAQSLRMPADALLGIAGSGPADDGPVLARLRQADEEELRFLLAVLGELHRFQRRRRS